MILRRDLAAAAAAAEIEKRLLKAFQKCYLQTFSPIM